MFCICRNLLSIEVDFKLNISKISTYASNVTIEYFVPPYLTFHSESSVKDFSKNGSNRYKYFVSPQNILQISKMYNALYALIVLCTLKLLNRK